MTAADTCGPHCSGPKVCEEPGCDVLHPNGCGADTGLAGWRCKEHEIPQTHRWVTIVSPLGPSGSSDWPRDAARDMDIVEQCNQCGLVRHTFRYLTSDYTTRDSVRFYRCGERYASEPPCLERVLP